MKTAIAFIGGIVTGVTSCIGFLIIHANEIRPDLCPYLRYQEWRSQNDLFNIIKDLKIKN